MRRQGPGRRAPDAFSVLQAVESTLGWIWKRTSRLARLGTEVTAIPCPAPPADAHRRITLELEEGRLPDNLHEINHADLQPWRYPYES